MITKAKATHREAVLSIDATLSVTIARRKIPLARALDLAPGAVLSFPQHLAQPLDIELSGRRLAEGRAVQVGDTLGVEIVQLLEPVR